MILLTESTIPFGENTLVQWLYFYFYFIRCSINTDDYTSARTDNLVFEATDSGRSFIKMRKSSGPSTDPCGTPLTLEGHFLRWGRAADQAQILAELHWLLVAGLRFLHLTIPVDFYYLEMILPISRYCL